MRKRLVLLPAVLLAMGCAAGGGKSNVVRVTVTDKGFEPEYVTVERGKPATLIITRKVDPTCADQAVFVSSGQTFALPLNVPVSIPIETATAETLDYRCTMEQCHHGAVVVK
jgi:plastocyanin domain-containing protein